MTTISILLAVGVGLSAARIALLAATIFTGQLSIGWSNDRIDAGRDRASGRADKPTTTGAAPLGVLALAAGLALVASAALAVLLGGRATAAALVVVAAGWAYNLGLKATVFSGAAYLVGFSALPAVPYLSRPGQAWPPWWAPVAAALLGLAAHFANVLPDLRADAATGVRGLPQRLGRRRGVIVMAVLLAAGSIVLGVGGADRSIALAVAAGLVGLAGGALAALSAVRRPDSELAFRVAVGLALVDVVLLVALAR